MIPGREYGRRLASRIMEGVTIRIVAGVVLIVVAVAAVAFLWELSLVAEGLRADRLDDPDGLPWFLVWLSSVLGRVLAIAIAVIALVVWLWEWSRHRIARRMNR